MFGLQRLGNRLQQVLADVVQVNVVAQASAESLYDPFGVVFAAEEASVDTILDAAAQWVEQGGDEQG